MGVSMKITQQCTLNFVNRHLTVRRNLEPVNLFETQVSQARLVGAKNFSCACDYHLRDFFALMLTAKYAFKRFQKLVALISAYALGTFKLWFQVSKQALIPEIKKWMLLQTAALSELWKGITCFS